MKKPSMAQVTGHRNPALISSKIQKKRMHKTGTSIKKTCTETINPKIQKGWQTHISI